MEKTDIKPGAVVQIDGTLKDCFFPGCFMLVTEVKSWGVQGFISMPGSRTELPGRAYFRASWDKIEYIGQAVWVPADDIPEGQTDG